MTCQEFWNDPPDLQGEPGAHLSECAACAARFERLGRLRAGLRAMAADDRAAGAPPRVEAHLLAAFRAGQAPPTRARILPFRWTTVLPLAAAAAVVLLAAGVWFWPHSPQAPAAHHQKPSQVEFAAIDDNAAPEPQVLDDGFIPIPNAERLEPGDDVNVVRMELPRSSMMTVGYDVNPDHASDLVEADVALGPDGLARAVKFLDSVSL